MRALILVMQVILISQAVAARPVLADSISLETNLFRLEISERGSSVALVDLRDETNHVVDKPVPFAVLVRGGKRHEASAVDLQGDRLHVSFTGTDVTAVIRVERQPEWLVFELEELSDEKDVEEVVFANVCVSIPARKVAVRAGCVSSRQFAVGCQALNMQTQSQLKLAGRPVSLMGRCYRRFGFKGARVALFAAPNEKLLDVVEAIEIAEPEVPHVTLDGVWARVSPDSRKSYLFIDMTEQNVDEVIRIAKELRFGYILIYANTWATSLGSYEINSKTYPHGPEGLRAVARKAHAAGLKVGIHCLTGFVNKRDPLTTPVPDPRLAKDDKVTLAADIDDRTKFVPTVRSPAAFPGDVAYGAERQGFDVQIDDEIISYRGLSTQPPYGLDKCIRGAHGTKRTVHTKGSTVWHLTQRYSHYLADCDTDLALQIARRYAEVINECELDMIYFDGANANTAFGREWSWRYVSQIPLQSEQLWRREVRVGGSCSGPLYWHMEGFKTCNDFVEIGVKRFLDHDKLRAAVGVKASFVPADLGWWGFHTWAPHRRSTTPDEIEYVCQKALGFDTCWSLETTFKKIHDCGRWPDIKTLIARYEQLRLADHFSGEIKKAIQQQGAEFKLVGTEREGWRLAPVQYGPAHMVLDEKSRSWTVANDLGPQPLRFRLYAIPILSPYDHVDNPVLIDQRDASRYVKARTAAQCQTSLEPSDQKTPVGEACVVFSAESELPNADGWAEQRADLVRLGERIAPPALIEGVPEQTTTTSRWSRGLGVWVHGDGKGEVLNVQLRAANGGYRDHYIDVDFTGWRYCELTRPESDRVFEFDAGYSRKHTVRHFQYDRITTVFLRYNSIPSQTEVRCLVGPIKALRERWLPVKDPSIAVGDEKIVFPCQLDTEQYLEFDGEGEARVFDREGVELGRIKPQGKPPVLQQGENRITYSSEATPETPQRAEISIIRVGDPL